MYLLYYIDRDHSFLVIENTLKNLNKYTRKDYHKMRFTIRGCCITHSFVFATADS